MELSFDLVLGRSVSKGMLWAPEVFRHLFCLLVVSCSHSDDSLAWGAGGSQHWSLQGVGWDQVLVIMT